jgi:transmembrane sensor
MTRPPDPVPDDLRRWLGGQPDADALERTWTAAGLAVPAPPTTDLGAARARLDARLDGAAAHAARRAPDRAPAASRRTPRRVVLVAVPLALVAVAAVGVWRGQTVTAEARGALLAVVLPDGSDVALSPGSRLSYTRGFGSRDVALTGEAFFAVVPDAARPFSVETAEARVVVVGTRFGVRAWAGRPHETSVVVEEGRVRVSARGGRREAVELTPGRRAVVAAGRLRSGPADVGAALAWRRAAFAVYDAPLGAVAVQVQRAFGTPVRLGPGVDVQERVTALLPRADGAEAVVEDLAATLGYRVRPRDGGFDLYP